MKITFGEAVGGLAMLAALAVVSYIAITTRSDTALGALLVVVSGGCQFFLRAKIDPPKS